MRDRIDPDQWSRLKQIFTEALDQPAESRDEFVRRSCAGEAKLEAEVMRLLAEDEAAGVFLGSPALGEFAAAAPEASPHFEAGTLLVDRFRIVRFIASGGMGEVYQAEDLELSEQVALKSIGPAIAMDKRALELFKKEIHLARLVTHPNVCRIFDLFHHREEDGAITHFLSMELLSGRTLGQRLAEDGPLPPQEALPLVAQMAEGLQAAHDAGVIHRDFKPGNVLLVPQDGQTRVAITDFGLAIAPVRGAEESLGAEGGTPDYMAPEQVEGGPTSAATDVYAFGLVIAEMVGGLIRPDTASGSEQKRSAGIPPAGGQTDETPPLQPRTGPSDRSRLKPEIRLPAEAVRWQSVLDRCLAQDPSHRFARPKDAAEALRRASQGMLPAPRRKLRNALIAALTATAIFAGVVWLRRGPDVAFNERDWVLISRFENGTGENILDGVPEYALRVELGNSPYVNVVPPERISDMLRLMKKPLDTAIDEAVGREICLRDGGIRALITGRTVKFGEKYLLSVEVRDPARNLTLAGLIQEAADQSQVLPAVRRLARELREHLGEEVLSHASGGEKLEAATTNSILALRFYTQAMELIHASLIIGPPRWAQAEQALRQAVDEDPEFPMARIMLVWAMRNQGKPVVEWQSHSDQAFRLAAAASDRERYFIQASYYTVQGADDRAIPLYETLVRSYPDDYWGVNNLSLALQRSGRFNEAVPYIMRRADLRPNGFGENTEAVLAVLRLGQDLSLIRPYVQRLQKLPFRTDDSLSASYELYPVFERWIENNPAMARDELARAAQGLETRIPEERIVLLARMRDWYSTLGMLASAERIEKTLESTNAFPPRFEYPWIAYARGDMDEFRRRAQSLLTVLPSGMGAITLARAGYVAEAEEWAATMESERRAPLMLTIVRGECALARGRRPEAIRLLQEALRQVRNGIYPQYFLSSEALADARLQEGDLDGAMETLEEASQAKHIIFYRNGAFWLRVRYRLAELYRRSGREAAAGRIEEELLQLLACADPDLHILRQLRQRTR